MLLRKNTKAFKTILEIISACRDRPDREALIRLYITRAGDTVKERISVEGIQGEAALFYEMGYQAVLGNLKSSNHQLHHSDEVQGIYFFHSSSNKVWDETPFEFDEAVKKEFASLPELPAVRKKKKAEKFDFPAPKMKTVSKPQPTDDAHARMKKGQPRKENLSAKEARAETKKGSGEKKTEKGDTRKSARVVALWPKQPDYHLKHEIHFTGLERIVFRQSQLTKRDILDYYNRISEYLLPYLKDRPVVIRLHRDGQQGSPIMTSDALARQVSEEIPDWIRSAPVGKGKGQEELLLCNDKEHLLFYVQIGSLEFQGDLSRIKSSDSPDYLVLGIESPDYGLEKALPAALATRDILTGLRLPSFVKTDGTSALHVYVPLDGKSDFEAAHNAAEYLCRLVRLKIPDLVSIKGSDASGYGKVLLDYSVNEPRKGVVVPYSLVAGSSANVATPLLWEEVKEGLKVEAFNHEAIFKRLKDEGDPFEALFKKKVDASALLERMEENYSFLFKTGGP